MSSSCLRLRPSYMKKWRLKWNRCTEERYATQSWYTPKPIARQVASFAENDLRISGEDPGSWMFWDPAAGSGRLYEFFPPNRIASDIRDSDFEFKEDGPEHYFPNTDFLTKTIEALRHVPYIYLITNPPYNHVSYRFINRAFDGTYSVHRALFIVSAGKQQNAFLQKVDRSKCILIKESEPFEAAFDIWLDSTKGGPRVPVYRHMKVKLLLYYSTDEFKRFGATEKIAIDPEVLSTNMDGADNLCKKHVNITHGDQTGRIRTCAATGAPPKMVQTARETETLADDIHS